MNISLKQKVIISIVLNLSFDETKEYVITKVSSLIEN